MSKSLSVARRSWVRTPIFLTIIQLLILNPAKSQVQVDNDRSSHESGDFREPVHENTMTNNHFRSPQDYANIRLTTNSGESVKPRAVVDDEFLYVVWEDTRDGDREIYWQKFDRDNASPVTSAIRVTNSPGPSLLPSIGIDAGGNSYIAWQEGSLYGTIMASKLGPMGQIVVAAVAVSPNLSLHPDIAAAPDGTNWIVYQRMANVSDQQVYLRKGTSTLQQLCLSPMSNTIWGAEKTPVVSTDGTNGWVAHYDLGDFFAEYLRLRLHGPSCNLLGHADQNQKYINPALGHGSSGTWAAAERNGTIYEILGSNSVLKISDIEGTSGAPRVSPDNTYGYFVWKDSRNGNDDIYVSRALESIDYPDEQVTSHSGSSQSPDIATPLAGDPGKFWIVWQDNRDGNWEIYVAEASLTNEPVTLTVKNAEGIPVTTQDAIVAQLRWDGSDWEKLDEKSSDASGNVTFALLTPGDALYARRMLTDSELGSTADYRRDGQTERELHSKKADLNYLFFVYDENTAPDLSYELYGSNQTDVTLDHRIARMDLVATFDYDVDVSMAIQMQQKLTVAAQRLYNATNGQFWIDSVTIYDRAEDPEDEKRNMQLSSDVRIVRRASQPFTLAVLYPVGELVGRKLGMPSSEWDKAIPELANFDPYLSHLPFRVILGSPATYDRLMFADEQGHYSFSKTLHHELGHYLFSLGDESLDKSSPEQQECSSHFCTDDFTSDHASIMTYVSNNEHTSGLITEFCHDENHIESLCSRMTSMWTEGYSCWEAIKFTYPWIRQVAGNGDEDFGPITSASPKFLLAPDLDQTFDGQTRSIRVHRPGSHRFRSERGEITLSRGHRLLEESGLGFSFGILSLQASSREIVDVRSGDLLTLRLPGYRESTLTIPAGGGSVIDVDMELNASSDGMWSSIQKRLLNPVSDRITATISDRGANTSFSLKSVWYGDSLPVNPRVRICALNDSCLSQELTHSNDTTFEAVFPLLDPPESEFQYTVLVQTASGDSILGFGNGRLASGDPLANALLRLEGIAEVSIPKANFSGLTAVLLLSASDVEIFDAQGHTVIADPVIVQIDDEDSLWSESGRIYFTVPPDIPDSSMLGILKWDGEHWSTLAAEYNQVLNHWTASIPGDGLYALAVKRESGVLEAYIEGCRSGLMIGDTATIHWSSSIAGDSLLVALSSDGGVTFPNQIYLDSLPQSGALDWLVSVPCDISYSVQITRFNGTDSYTDQIGPLLVFRARDVTSDCKISIDDAVHLVNYIFADGPEPQPFLANGDFDCNNRVDITDCVYLINYIFAGGPAPCAACP